MPRVHPCAYPPIRPNQTPTERRLRVAALTSSALQHCLRMDDHSCGVRTGQLRERYLQSDCDVRYFLWGQLYPQAVRGLLKPDVAAVTQQFNICDSARRLRVGCTQRSNDSVLPGPPQNKRVYNGVALVPSKSNILSAERTRSNIVRRALQDIGTFAINLPRACLVDGLAVCLHPGCDPVKHRNLFAVDGSVRPSRNIENECAILADRVD